MLPKRARRLRQQGQGQGGSDEGSDGSSGSGGLAKHQLPYEPLAPAERLPRTLSWRGTGADGPVYDQANCGSCWAFAAGGAMEGAWFLGTGERASFSQQQILDCSWGYDVRRPSATMGERGGGREGSAL